MACCISAFGRKKSDYGGSRLEVRAEVGTALPHGGQEFQEVELWGGHIALNLGPVEGSYSASAWGPLH